MKRVLLPRNKVSDGQAVSSVARKHQSGEQQVILQFSQSFFCFVFLHFRTIYLQEA